MSKFYGAIGYSVTAEIRPGVWGEKITVRDYYGDVIRNTRQYQSSDNLNDNLNVSNEFSIVADPFAYANFHSMRFIEYMGAKTSPISVRSMPTTAAMSPAPTSWHSVRPR